MSAEVVTAISAVGVAIVGGIATVATVYLQKGINKANESIGAVQVQVNGQMSNMIEEQRKSDQIILEQAVKLARYEERERILGEHPTTRTT
jgi:hypothetical protein